jgi:hypothetical protein
LADAAADTAVGEHLYFPFVVKAQSLLAQGAVVEADPAVVVVAADADGLVDAGESYANLF